MTRTDSASKGKSNGKEIVTSIPLDVLQPNGPMSKANDHSKAIKSAINSAQNNMILEDDPHDFLTMGLNEEALAKINERKKKK